MKFLIATVCGLLSITAPAFSQAKEWRPEKPVRLILPYAAGGTADAQLRTLQEPFQALTGQPLIIESRPGAAGQIGAALVARSPADGYTLVQGALGNFATAKAMNPALSYDQEKDFAVVIMLADVPNLVEVHPSLPIHSIKELIAYARANPGGIRFGTAGVGASNHLSVEIFRQMTNTDLVAVHYGGGAAALNDLTAGHIEMMMDNISSSLPFVRAGRLRPLAVTSSKRSPILPDVPTVAEAGVPGYGVTSWTLIAAPAATPKEVVDSLNKIFQTIFEMPSVRAKLQAQGATIIGGTPEEARKYVSSEIRIWTDVLRKLETKK
ncbi:MAG: Bug family tripartite tricarboxylate transporter substrate binding protein [Alphaproteobacteria bacterium]